MPRQLTSASSLQVLKKEARRWLRALRAGDANARARLKRVQPDAASQPALRDVQHALAREYGYESWLALKAALRRIATPDRAGDRVPSPAECERIVGDILLAFNDRDEPALARLNARRGTSFSFDDLAALIWGRVYAYRQRASGGERRYLLLDEARTLVAQNAGFSSWAALIGSGGTVRDRVPAFVVDERENRVAPLRSSSTEEWEELIDTVKQRRITAIDAGGQMTDALLARVASLDHVTALRLAGSQQVSDQGLQHLARMPQLEHLSLSHYPGGKLTDRGLEVLRELKNLRSFEMTWQRGISDAGVRHLEACDRLERVDLMGTPTGDGLIEAMQGKTYLRTLRTGRLVTDAGLARLRGVPRLCRPAPAAGEDDQGAHLLLDGPFTDAGFAHVGALEGLEDLDLFWHVTGITAAAFAHLTALPRLHMLAADGALSGDGAMRHIAAIPRLRSLRAQESAATDDGFEALSRSRTLESFWGRHCEHFGSRAFIAFSRLPVLRDLGVSLKSVDDSALAALQDFPALRTLTPIGVEDAGFQHIGRCERLERLTCMYCRTTTDAATEHVAALRLTHYYAGLTLITDRSLEILGSMTTLEQVDLYECNGVTDAGLAWLARLPRLRKVALDSLPGVSLEGTRVFPRRVEVTYTT